MIGTRQIIATFDLFSVLVVLLSSTRVSISVCSGKMRTTPCFSSCSFSTLTHIQRASCAFSRSNKILCISAFCFLLFPLPLPLSLTLSFSLRSHSLSLSLFPQALTLTAKQVLPIPLACLYYMFFSIFFDRSHPIIR